MSETAVLLSFTGFQDPYSSKGPVAGSRQQGPILSLLAARRFTEVILLSNPTTVQNMEETAKAIAGLHPSVKVETHPLSLTDPTDYFAILSSLRELFPRIAGERENARYFVATASGTPQMHAAWVLLAAGGEIPARLLHVRPPQFVTGSAPLVSEVDLSRPEFPKVRWRAFRELSLESDFEADPKGILGEFGVVGDDPAFLKALETAALAAGFNEPVLILGENGTGKELIALLAHSLSHRSSKPLVTVNCAAIPRDLAESILFGHRKGAFTGATADQKGKFELADGGTLFLDEVAELSPEVQAKLLRAVEKHEIEPLGRGGTVKVDVRLITATNRPLEEEVRKGAFRQDLYFRLKGVTIDIPPLRRRRADIAKLAIHFLDEFARQNDLDRVFAPEALAKLQSHPWPGNVRELQRLVRATAIKCRAKEIRPEHVELGEGFGGPDALPDPHPGFSIEDYLREVREKLFRRALDIAGRNQSEAARLLGISPAAVSKFLKR